MDTKANEIIMKQISLFFALIFLWLAGDAQLIVTPGAQWVNTGTVKITLNDVDFINNGSFTENNSVMQFSGSTGSKISGSSATTFYDLEIAKTGLNKLTLLSNIDVASKITFTSGLIDLNQNIISLAANAYLQNESELSRIIGPLGGEVSITLVLGNPSNYNPGNLGAVLTTNVSLGSTTISRGHKTPAGTGLQSAVNRYYSINPSQNTNLDGTLRFKYFDAELNAQNENTMEMFKSIDNGATWSNQNFSTRDIAANYVEKIGIPSFSRWTLSSNGAVVLPVTGLQFYAKRISHDKVLLDWKTIQELNNRGFYIERRKENENNFSVIGFVNSIALGGNSSFPLQYSLSDDNTFTGKTFYRLKQTDIDNRFTYSEIRVVNGDATNAITLTAWPIPSAGNFTVSVEGIEKDVLLIYDMAGKLIRQQNISSSMQQKIYGLTPGTYILRLAGQKGIQQKMIVQ